MAQANQFPYVLITPAHNEEAYIEKTISSMVVQTMLPVKWVIVNDGSTDRTHEIISSRSAKYPWIEYVRLPEHTDRQFAAKVRAFNHGYAKVHGLEYSIIGNLDADLSFDPDYMEFLLNKFADNPRLGVAGTPFIENAENEHYDFRFADIQHVSGACQMFRRECFESIGGYIPIRGGGIDWVAVTSSRMKGWETRTFTGKTLFHHRSMGTGKGSKLYARYRLGKEDYYLGGHPLWELFRSVFQMKYKPFIIGGVSLLAGYCIAALKRTKRPIPPDLVAFHRKEQLKRLRAKFF
jgi:poly-beta-1,6-N-acetyl-D-glucosamine synthase